MSIRSSDGFVSDLITTTSCMNFILISQMIIIIKSQVAEIQNQLDKLEETANRLNRERQKGISGITYINDRIKAALRKKDKVCEEEYRAFRDKKVDPFTRRQTAPILVSNTNIETKAQIKDVLSERYTEDIDMHYESLTFVKENKKAEDKKQQEKVDANDLYK